MTLTDEQVERYSRQILLPEVGGRGQARLLGARVALAGSDEAAGVAATLLGRAGVGTLDLVATAPVLGELSPDCRVERHARSEDTVIPDATVIVAADPALATALGRRAQVAGRPAILGTLDGEYARVTTLVGRPCIACLPARALTTTRAADAGVLAAPLALALGALAASETLHVLLDPPARGRVQAIGLAPGDRPAGPLEGGDCALCGAT